MDVLYVNDVMLCSTDDENVPEKRLKLGHGQTSWAPELQLDRNDTINIFHQ